MTGAALGLCLKPDVEDPTEGDMDDGGAGSADDESAAESKEESAGSPASAKGKAAGKAKGKAKAKAKGKAKANRESATGSRHGVKRKAAADGTADDADGDNVDYKKCNKCKKWLVLDCFHTDQGKCKVCAKRARAFDILVGNEGLCNEMGKMSKESPKEHEKIFGQYMKHMDEQEKSRAKIKFSLHCIVREYKASQGMREAAEYEMMWEQEYYEFAQTAKCGFG